MVVAQTVEIEREGDNRHTQTVVEETAKRVALFRRVGHRTGVAGERCGAAVHKERATDPSAWV